MNQVAVVDDMNKQMIEIEQTQKMCALLMKTPHYAKMGQEGIYAVVAKAKAVGIDPIEALNGALYYVNGRVGMSSEMMNRLARCGGHSITKNSNSTNSCCILTGKRRDTGDTWTVGFSIEDAKRAGIYKDSGTWAKYPDVMCYNRAMAKLFRQLFPDLCKGAGYTLDELKEIEASDLRKGAGYTSHEPKEIEAIDLPVETSVTVEVTPDIVSQDQAAELKQLLASCDPGYQTQVLTSLKNGIEQLPSRLYERLKNAALKKAEEYQESISIEPTVSVFE